MNIMDNRGPNRADIRISAAEQLIAEIRERARNLYLTRQMLCSEAVATTLNCGLNGGLPEAQVIALAAPFSEALGGSGCVCGALSGAVMACGLFIGNGRFNGSRRDARDNARQLHEEFRATHGTTCCRVLTRKIRHDEKAHFKQCAELTANGAEMAARLILAKRPDLIPRADSAYLTRRESAVGGALLRLIQHFSRRR